MRFIVYMATNTVNGKRYIGVTGRGLAYRRKRHILFAGQGGRQCPRFYDAIRKYGADNFVWRVIAEFYEQVDAYNHENVAVTDLCPEYNAAAGGRVGPAEAWNKIPVVCLEDGVVHESASAAANAYGVDHSDVSKVCKGQKGSAAGRHFCFSGVPLTEAERRQRIEEIDLARVARRRRTETRKTSTPVSGGVDSIGRSAAGPMSRARRVVCIDDGNVFESATAAAQHYDVAKSALIELCLGKNYRKTVGGKRFQYVD